MTDPSVLAAVRDGGWHRLDVGRFEVVVAIAGALDVITTAEILANGRPEANRLLTRLAEVDVRLAVGFFSLAVAFTVAICWVDLGWLPAVVGMTAIATYGTGGLHNLTLHATGWAPKAELPLAIATQVHYVEPVAGTLAGFALATYWYGWLPLREVGAYSTLLAADLTWQHLLL